MKRLWGYLFGGIRSKAAAQEPPPSAQSDYEQIPWNFEYYNVEDEDNTLSRYDSAELESSWHKPADELDSTFVWNDNYDQDLPERIPLAWQNGSEQQLRDLAIAICRTEPGLFDAQEAVMVVYKATTPDKRGGFLYVERTVQGVYERLTSRRLMSLCDLAFRLNPCIGMHWVMNHNWVDNPNEDCYLQQAAERVRITVMPPSAHEKVEAFLTLVDWLDDKLHNPEKRAWYGLPLLKTGQL